MFKNQATDGRKNSCGTTVAALRKKMNISQRELAARLQLVGLDIDKNAIQKIEAGQRFVTDIEVIAFARFFSISPNDLLLPVATRGLTNPQK